MDQQNSVDGSDGGLVICHISQQKQRNVAKPVLSLYMDAAKIKMPSAGRGGQVGGGKRGVVSEFSAESRGRLLFAAFNAIPEWQAFITLTYPKEFPTDGKLVKSHLNTFLTSARREYDGVKYMWAIEFQKRGAPHYHILADAQIPKAWLSKRWYEIVDSHDEKHFRAGTSVQSCETRQQGAFYMLKQYTSKRFQKIVPNEYQDVGRFWGTSRGIVRPVMEYVLPDDQDAMFVYRTLRRWTEKHLHKKAVNVYHDGKPRARTIHRVPKLFNIHGNERHKHPASLTSHRAVTIAARLLGVVDAVELQEYLADMETE